MQLQLQNFSTMVSNAAAAVQGAASQLIDLTVGSTLRAILEANAALGLWMQWLVVEVLSTTRAATCNGPDLDSFVADFTVSRLPASSSSGTVQFSRFTPSQPALIPVGATVRTTDGSKTFAITQDATNPAWSAAQAGYVLGAGISSVLVPIQAAVAGNAGNVQTGAITVLATAIAGIDTVTNPSALVGGFDAESDTALRSRFASFLASRARGTPLAIGNALLSVQQGIDYTIQENLSAGGTVQMGSFLVTIDDGSGNPPPALLAAAGAAVEAVRPIGSIYAVQPPTVTTANVTLSITTAAAANHAIIAGNVAAELTSAIAALKLGVSLPWSRLTQLAYAADSNVINVTSVLMNGTTSDLTPSLSGLIRPGTIVVS